MTLDLGRIGLWTGALDALEVAAARDAVAEIEAQGWGALWVPEAYGREAFTSAGVYLAASRRMVVATGIANIYGRDAVTANAATRTLDAAYPDRFLAGLGVSHSPIVERLRGHAYAKPLSAMRAYLDAMDAATYAAAGRPGPAPRVLAALGPKMLELSRDRALGAFPYLVTPAHTAQAREVLGAGAVLAVEQAVVLSDEVSEWRSRAHAHLEIYTGLPNYRNSWVREGFSADEDFGRGGSDRLKAALVPRGVEAGVARVAEHFAAGASHVCVQVLGKDAVDVPREGWQRFAEALL